MGSHSSAPPVPTEPTIPLHSLPSQERAARQNQHEPGDEPSPSMDLHDGREKIPYVSMGYPAFTKWMASSEDFFVLRRFNRLNAWVQLQWQDDITRLEEELEEVNKQCRRNADKGAYCHSVRNDPMVRRQEILRELRPLLKEYNEFVLSYSQLRKRPSAADYQVENVKNLFWNYDYIIDEKEQKFVEKESDLISVVERKKSLLRKMMEKLWGAQLSYIFPARDRADRFKGDSTKYSSFRKFEGTMTVTVISIGLMSLLVPMWWLNYVRDDDKRLGIISGFIVLFAGVLASATVQQPFEVMAGTAAYAAVLIVFLQQGSPGSGGSYNIP